MIFLLLKRAYLVSFTVTLLLILILAIKSVRVDSRVINFETDIGGIPNDATVDTVWKNGKLFNITLSKLQPGDVLVFPEKEFHVMGGVFATNLKSVTFQIDGIITFSDNFRNWPRLPNNRVRDCLEISNSENITFSSSKRFGTLHGNGPAWWNFPFLGYALHLEERPRILYVNNSTQILVEKLFFRNSPFWSTLFENVVDLEIRYSGVSNRRTPLDGHSVVDMTAFNTDGFDITGKNIYIHDVSIWTQDDCIGVKDGSENVLVERVDGTCLGGLTLGSMGSSINRNITFRDCYIHNSFKGIYLKFRRKDPDVYDPRKPCPCTYEHSYDGGLIQDVTFENIVLDSPAQWAIWIGPAQQVNARDPSSCSLSWPVTPGARCSGQPNGKYRNLLLRNITIYRKNSGIGVILADPQNPIENIHFDNVIVLPSHLHAGAHSHPKFFPLPDVDSVDPYVSYWLLSLVGTMLALALSCHCFPSGCRSSCGCINVHHFKVVGLLLLLYCGFAHFSNPDLTRGDIYFQCNGVVNATVTGTSWPIPHCFNNSVSIDNTTENGTATGLNHSEEDEVLPAHYRDLLDDPSFIHFVTWVPGYLCLGLLHVIEVVISVI